MTRSRGAPFRNPLKSELHHWWPKSLSRFWADEQGCVTQECSDGSIACAPPKNFGANTNTHHLKIADNSPWNATLEPLFGEADAAFPDLVTWLCSLETSQFCVSKKIEERLLSQPLSDDRNIQLSHGLASLILRSPFTRNNIQLSVEHSRRRFGFNEDQCRADSTLIAGNMNGRLGYFTYDIAAGGVFAVLFSDTKEFIFGDGFLHNFNHVSINQLSPRVLVPLLPSVAVLFARPAGCRPANKLFTLRLEINEVDRVNELVQLYSRDFIFYRSQRPNISDHFLARQFRSLRGGKELWLEKLIATAINYSD